LPSGSVAPKAIASGILPVGELPCAVLDDSENTRVLTQTGILRALGRFATPRSVASHGVVPLPPFLRAKNLAPFISKDLVALSTPIIFDTGVCGSLAVGFKAQLLPDVCSVYREAARKRALLPNQKRITLACKTLLTGLADVAIDELVDVASGFPERCSREAAIKLVEKYIRSEALPLVKMFDGAFYKEMFRLYGYAYCPVAVKRPRVFARQTEDIYSRLAPEAREELQELVKRWPSDRTGEQFFQHLPHTAAYKALLDLIKTAKMVIRVSGDPKDFERNMDRLYPRFNLTDAMA